jgi:hypothetical protein
MSALQDHRGIAASRRAAEERWCGRVRAAKLRFDLAIAESARALGEHDITGLEMAQAIEEEAREEYLRELRIFTDMVMRGKMPGEE